MSRYFFLSCKNKYKLMQEIMALKEEIIVTNVVFTSFDINLTFCYIGIGKWWRVIISQTT